MYEIGRLCVKIAGRDARGKCVVVDVLDDKTVMIDGQVRRKKCNTKHLEPLDTVLKIKKGATHAEVVKALNSEGIQVKDTKKKEQKEKPRKKHRAKKVEAAPKQSKALKPMAKKESKK